MLECMYATIYWDGCDICLLEILLGDMHTIISFN